MKTLIVDDNYEFCTTISDIMDSFGLESQIIQSPEEAIQYVNRFYKNILLILLDIEFGPDTALNGLDVLEHVRHNFPALPVVMISGKGNIEIAVRATKLGAINFIEKSIVTKEKLREVLSSAIEKLGPQGDAKEIRRFLESQGIYGHSLIINSIGENIIRFGRTDLNVLITGETGTGKKLAAKALHSVSKRSKYPFVTVDIPNIPRDLFQSELFGHLKGAFTGATEPKKGLFHKANKGTLFLDEIGDLPPELQSNLFIPIEDKEIKRVGSTENEPVDIRFISATDRDLITAMNESRFREQLYHRLRECEINLPPLRERAEDIPDICEYYLFQHNIDFKDSKQLSPASVEFLQEQKWHGNVRELASVIRVVLQTTTKEQIEVSDLTKVVSNSSSNYERNAIHTPNLILDFNRSLKEDLAITDKIKIEQTLDTCNGNVSKAAAILCVSRETLHHKIRRYEINPDVFRHRKIKK